MITKASGNNEDILLKLHQVFDRQKEVVIGKRNINCLSCKEEPEKDTVPGFDGRVYKGNPLTDMKQ